jgi:hypothetical protein
MAERQLKGLCYNCDEKYFPGQKCKEQKIFMAISEKKFRKTPPSNEETPLTVCLSHLNPLT